VIFGSEPVIRSRMLSNGVSAPWIAVFAVFNQTPRIARKTATMAATKIAKPKVNTASFMALTIG